MVENSEEPFGGWLLVPMLKYVNSRNQEIVLNGNQIAWTNLDKLRSYEWSFDTTRRPTTDGGVLYGFTRNPRKVDLSVAITCNSLAELYDYVNHVQEVTEPDIAAEIPGKIYINEQYSRGYVTSAETQEFNAVGCFAIIQYTLMLTDPYWCTEENFVFNVVATSSSETDTTGKKYNLRYPYRYKTGLFLNRLISEHFVDCPAIITFYGACANPSVEIDGIIREVDETITAGQRIVIDQTDRSITKIDASGTRTNVFNSRNKDYDIFAPIPMGEVEFLYSGEFKIAITLIQRRSMPIWTN